MKALAWILIGLGVAGCLLALAGAAGSMQWEALDHTLSVHVAVPAQTLLVSAPFLIGGIALWLYAVRRDQRKRLSSADLDN